MAIVQQARCESCGRTRGDTHRALVGVPDDAQLTDELCGSSEGVCETTDGCHAEPDGHCEHGHPSWWLELGII